MSRTNTPNDEYELICIYRKDSYVIRTTNCIKIFYNIPDTYLVAEFDFYKIISYASKHYGLYSLHNHFNLYYNCDYGQKSQVLEKIGVVEFYPVSNAIDEDDEKIIYSEPPFIGMLKDTITIQINIKMVRSQIEDILRISSAAVDGLKDLDMDKKGLFKKVY